MHPEILRELSAQRGREMRARANLSRLAILASRRRRNKADVMDDFIIPVIPDYVDGSFRTEPANTGPAADQAIEAGQAPAHHAA